MTQVSLREFDHATDGDLVGSFHRFGEDGIDYEVTDLAGDRQVWIRVLESGETLRYPADNVRRDLKI